MYSVLIGSRALNYWNPDRKISASTNWFYIEPKEVLVTQYFKTS